MSMFDAIQELRPLWNRGQVQNHLGAFGFSGEEVFREISSLSGGERARMALARMTLAKANLLVLDEPTNHLDVENIEVLEDALDDYEGTVLLVSHDRAFLREVATRVWWFEGTRLKDFDGPFTEWEESRAAALPAPRHR
jgi:ATP-binding cassette, subfamily F, member 3